MQGSYPHEETYITHDDARLFITEYPSKSDGLAPIIKALKQDQVILVQHVNPDAADALIGMVAEKFNLREKLEAQAAFSSIQGHRERTSKYFMSVNQRSDYQFIPPHSEGQEKMGMQLASLYCHENSTDGGNTILLNTDSEGLAWNHLHQVVKKLDLCGKSLSSIEIAKIKMIFQVGIPEDLIHQGDNVFREIDCPIPDVKFFEVLEKPKKIYSKILEKSVYVYWDNIASVDFDSGKEYINLLASLNLLKAPSHEFNIHKLDNSYERRVWSSGVKYKELFKSKIVRKLKHGELVILNNLTWTHSTSNWTPDSGVRRVVAAFA